MENPPQNLDDAVKGIIERTEFNESEFDKIRAFVRDVVKKVLKEAKDRIDPNNISFSFSHHTGIGGQFRMGLTRVNGRRKENPDYDVVIGSASYNGVQDGLKLWKDPDEYPLVKRKKLFASSFKKQGSAQWSKIFRTVEKIGKGKKKKPKEVLLQIDVQVKSPTPLASAAETSPSHEGYPAVPEASPTDPLPSPSH